MTSFNIVSTSFLSFVVLIITQVRQVVKLNLVEPVEGNFAVILGVHAAPVPAAEQVETGVTILVKSVHPLLLCQQSNHPPRNFMSPLAFQG
jgi:hypothetical protein